MHWADTPSWLQVLSVASLAVAALCAVWIVVDLLAGHKQHMWIMNLVWPITALWGGPMALWAYYAIGRAGTHQQMAAGMQSGSMHESDAMQHGGDMHRADKASSGGNPSWQSVAKGTTHCGSGCTLGDILAEWFLYFFPAVTLFGVTIRFELFGQQIFAAWVVDYVLAFLFGVAFQYYTIKPMRNISSAAALAAAIKADALSLSAWQVGMYGWMAISTFAIFGEFAKTNPAFWFMMQIAMCAGFATSYPVNWWLIRTGVKEAM